jgi:hypothetical protein
MEFGTPSDQEKNERERERERERKRYTKSDIRCPSFCYPPKRRIFFSMAVYFNRFHIFNGLAFRDDGGGHRFGCIVIVVIVVVVVVLLLLRDYFVHHFTC